MGAADGGDKAMAPSMAVPMAMGAALEAAAAVAIRMVSCVATLAAVVAIDGGKEVRAETRTACDGIVGAMAVAIIEVMAMVAAIRWRRCRSRWRAMVHVHTSGDLSMRSRPFSKSQN